MMKKIAIVGIVICLMSVVFSVSIETASAVPPVRVVDNPINDPLEETYWTIKGSSGTPKSFGYVGFTTESMRTQNYWIEREHDVGGIWRPLEIFANISWASGHNQFRVQLGGYDQDQDGYSFGFSYSTTFSRLYCYQPINEQFSLEHPLINPMSLHIKIDYDSDEVYYYAEDVLVHNEPLLYPDLVSFGNKIYLHFWCQTSGGYMDLFDYKVIYDYPISINAPGGIDYVFRDQLEIPINVACGEFPENSPYTLEWEVMYNSLDNPDAIWNQKTNQRIYDIIGTSTANYWTVSGNRTEEFTVGDHITVVGNQVSENNRLYTIDNIIFDQPNVRTQIYVFETIPSPHASGDIYLGTDHVSVQLSQFEFTFTAPGESIDATIYQNVTGVFGGDQIFLDIYLLNASGSRVARWGNYLPEDLGDELPDAEDLPDDAPFSLADIPTWIWGVMAVMVIVPITLVILARKKK